MSTSSVRWACPQHGIVDRADTCFRRGRPCHPLADLRVRGDKPEDHVELLRRQLPHDGRREPAAGDVVESEGAVEGRWILRVPESAHDFGLSRSTIQFMERVCVCDKLNTLFGTLGAQMLHLSSRARKHENETMKCRAREACR